MRASLTISADRNRRFNLQKQNRLLWRYYHSYRAGLAIARSLLQSTEYSFFSSFFQLSTVVALHFDIPITAPRAHVGKHLQSGARRGGLFIVDAHGQNLLTALAFSDGLREARIPHFAD
jgi:hypothetical protein